MTKENSSAFEKFDDYLRLRLKDGTPDADFDFRNWLLSKRDEQWNIGYRKIALEKKYAINFGKLFPKARGIDDPSFGNGTNYMLFGAVYQDPKNSHKGSIAALQKYEVGNTLVFVEQGFLATSHSWSEAFENEDPKLACLGYVYDDISFYFMADFPSRFTHKMNSEEAPTENEIARARALIARIVDQKISKYNSQPIVKPSLGTGYKRRVLVCDQSFADASTVYGKLTEHDFEQMLLSAIRENPDAEIIVKTHPDTHWQKGKRIGYFNDLQDEGRVRILRDPINPYCMFDYVDKVYVGSSQIGLEALMAGKEVVCFGAPFYSGWGLTDDRQPIPHRKRKRSLEELFHYFYIWYTIYHVPNCALPSEIEDVLDYILANRPVKDNIKRQQMRENPKVSIVIPVYGVENYIDQCLRSVREQSLDDIEIITVNDCSPDQSQAIIDRHAAEDDRIRPIILDVNRGQGLARNIGIEAARGEYVFFLDSDDLLYAPTVLETALNAMSAEQSDMIRVQKVIFEDGMAPEKGWLDDSERYFQRRMLLPNVQHSTEILKSWHIWLFLYKRDLLIRNDIRFKTGQWEERAFVCECYRLANQICCVPIRGVAYRKRAGSTTDKVRTQADFDMFMTNISGVLSSLKGTAGESVALYQMVAALMNSGWWATVRTVAEKLGKEKVLARIRAVFGDDHELELDENPIADFGPLNLQKPRLDLALAAIYASRWDLVQLAATRESIPQARYIEEMLRVPAGPLETQLQEAYSLYARNDLVVTDIEAAEAGRTLERKPRLIIHIGSTKTGSTFIQHFLEKNRAALLRAGIYVPEVGLFWQPTRPHKQSGHSFFMNDAIAGRSVLKDHVEATLKLVENGIHTVVLSSEAYFLEPRSIELARQFSDYQVEMVVYLRRQDDWANSQYAEFVAGGAIRSFSGTVDEWLLTERTKTRLDYLGTLENWRTVLDKSCIRVGIYDRMQLKDQDIVTDFLHLTGLDDIAGLPRPKPFQENGLPFGSVHVRLIRRLNAGKWSDKTAYLNFIEEAGQAITQIMKRRGQKMQKLALFSNAQRVRILESVSAGNARIASEYLGRANGLLFKPFAPEETDTVAEQFGQEVITLEELDAIMDAHHKWTAALPDYQAVRKKMQRDALRKTYGYRLALLCSFAFLTKSNRKKMTSDPDQFLTDTKNPVMKQIYREMCWERRMRGTVMDSQD